MSELGWSAARARFGTVRFRVTLLATALVAAALLAASVGLVATQRSSLTTAVDLALQQRADNIAPAITRDPSGAKLPVEGDREDSFVQLLDGNGTVVVASSNAAALSAVSRPPATGDRERIATVSHIALSTHEFRVLTRRISTSSGEFTLIVGKNLDDVLESVEVLKSSLAVSVPIVLVLLAALVWWLTGRVLRPVEAIRAEVAGIGAEDLHRRVPTSDRDDEIARLARTMNAMLDRVERASKYQRQFVADASHELRSPLTRLRTELELRLAHPDVDDRIATYASLLADATEMERLIDDLLLAARLEAEPGLPTREAVDLDDLVVTEAKRLRDRGRVRVDTTGVSAARVAGDSGQLARAVRNLVDNAERHAASSVAFSVVEHGDRSELVVSDDGPGIAAAHHAAVFERFTRLDEARSRDLGGSGLGLAIVHDIITRHGGSIVLDSAEGLGSRFVVTLPRAE